MFDPYYTWLGIAPDEQPADYYRLLGLRRFESNPAVISNASDRQLAHLRTFQSGPHTAESQRLLNEVAAATHTLLNPHYKATYDRQLAAGGGITIRSNRLHRLRSLIPRQHCRWRRPISRPRPQT